MKKQLLAALLAAALCAPAAAADWIQHDPVTLSNGEQLAMAIDVESVEADRKQVTAVVRVRNLDRGTEEHYTVLVPGKVCASGVGRFSLYDSDGQLTAQPQVIRSKPRNWDSLALSACYARAGALGIAPPTTWFLSDETERAPRRNAVQRDVF